MVCARLRVQRGIRVSRPRVQVLMRQIKFWGIHPSYACVAEPEGNGVVERYNAEWLVEKNGFLSPNQAREQWNAARSLSPAA